MPFLRRIYWPLWLFGIATLLFHAVLFLIRPSGIEWHYVDYIWLVTAGSGLVFAVQKARQGIAGYSLAGVRQRLPHVRLNLLSSLESQHRMYTKMTPLPQFNPQSMTACTEWIDRMQAIASADEFVATTFREMLESGDDNWDSPDLSRTKEWLAGLCEEWESLLARESHLEQLKEETGFEVTLMLCYPWVFAIVLALRITKVTAGLEGLIPPEF